MIQAFPNRPSLFAGELLTLYVSTTAPWFRIDLYRQGETLDLMTSSDWLAGQFVAAGSADADWSANPGWPGYQIQIPPTWRSGAYIAILVEANALKVQTTTRAVAVSTTLK